MLFLLFVHMIKWKSDRKNKELPKRSYHNGKDRMKDWMKDSYMKEFLEIMEKNEELGQKVARMDADGKTQPSDYITLAAEYGITLMERDFE